MIFEKQRKPNDSRKVKNWTISSIKHETDRSPDTIFIWEKFLLKHPLVAKQTTSTGTNYFYFKMLPDRSKKHWALIVSVQFFVKLSIYMQISAMFGFKETTAFQTFRMLMTFLLICHTISWIFDSKYPLGLQRKRLRGMPNCRNFFQKDRR